MSTPSFFTPLALVFCCTTPLQATTWKNANAIGGWDIPANWTLGVPASNTDALIHNGGTALIFDPGANAESVFLGLGGQSGGVSISGGGTLAQSGGAYIGVNLNSTGSLTVSGLGSSWTAGSGSVHLGGTFAADASGHGILRIENGGYARANNGKIGWGSASTGSATVTGNGFWEILTTLDVGYRATGSLTVSDGGSVSSATGASIGWAAGSNGSATVTGANSLWVVPNSSSLFRIGDAGSGTLTISNGGRVSSITSMIAAQPGSTGTATVTGAGSSWSSTGNLYVGGRDGGAGASVNGGSSSLRIQNGGLVEAANLMFFNNGVLEVDNGSTTVSGLTIVGGGTPPPPGGTLGDMVVGTTTAGRMEIRNGGRVVNNRLFIGHNSGGDGAVLVTGSGRSALENRGSIWVGNSGKGTLEIHSQQTVESAGHCYIGFSPGSAGEVTVRGFHAALKLGGNLYIGGNGSGPGGSGILRFESIRGIYAFVVADAVIVYHTGVLALGVAAALVSPLTFLGGRLQTSDNITFGNDFMLGAGGVVVQTLGFNSTFSGTISGTGGLTKYFLGGEGTLNLTGNNTYTGPTRIDTGTLLVNGSITSAVTVGGGTLGGSGAVGSVTVNDGGIVAPGNSAGRLTLNGNYNQTSGGKLAIELGGYTPGTGHDQLAVSGHAIVGGTLNASLANGFRPNVGDTFQIITSNSEAGNFSTINSPGFTVRSDATATGIVLVVTGVDPIPLVENNNDDGPGSLRFVIANALAGSTIVFAPNVRGAINLTSGELLIDKNLKIDGPGANVLTVQRSAVADTPNFRIFSIESASVTATISGLSIANGNTFGNGGGISNSGGTVTIASSTISGNRARNGGGIFSNFGAVTIVHSTISENTVSSSFIAGSGGGIFNSGGMLTIDTSTISGNTALGPGGNSDSGGGIITNVGTVILTNSTITDNRGDIGGGVRNVNGGTVRARNTIIALNTSPSGPDFNGPLTSEGYNLIGNTSGAPITGTATGNQLNLDPLLDTLKDNGGPTWTHALLSGSPAIDKGYAINAAATNLSFRDQRGFTRPVDQSSIIDARNGDDIGAMEFGALPLRFISITRLDFGLVVTFADVAVGATYRLERNLLLTDSTWATIAGVNDVTAAASGTAQITDPNAAGLGRAFYRVRLLP